MWWVLAAALVLVLFEQVKKTDAQKTELYNFKNYFWLGANLIVLSLLVPFLTQFFYNAFETLRFYPLINVSESHLVFQFIVFLIFIDFSRYILHYIFHKINFLWKMHMVHHSSEEINTLASFKYSWSEAFIDIAFGCFLEKFFRVDLQVLMIVNGLSIYICLWQHSRIDIFDIKNPLFNAIFMTPKKHRIHHEKTDSLQFNNLGFIFIFWDKLFKTYSVHEGQSPAYGINEPVYPYHSNLKQLFYPLTRSPDNKPKANLPS